MTDGRRIGLASFFLLVALILTGLCWNANAQDFPPGEDQIVPLIPGDRVPFEGQLFSTDTAIRWGFRLQRLRLQLEEDVAREREICAAQNDLLETKLRLASENQEFQLTTLQTQLADEHQTILDLTSRLSTAEDTPWYETWGFGFAVGAIGALVLVIATGYALGAV